MTANISVGTTTSYDKKTIQTFLVNGLCRKTNQVNSAFLAARLAPLQVTFLPPVNPSYALGCAALVGILVDVRGRISDAALALLLVAVNGESYMAVYDGQNQITNLALYWTKR